MRSSADIFFMSAIECDAAHARTGACAYQVAWTINPHMRVGSVDPARARVEHRALAAAMRRESAQVVELPFVHGAYDSVFSKDSALLVERRGVRRALLSHPRHRVRRREQRERARAFADRGFEVAAPHEVTWEGGDVAVLPANKGLLLGHGQRSQRRAATWLEREVGAPVLPLELRDSYLFHLDMALTVLPDGALLLCEEAFTRESLRDLRRLLRDREIVTVERREALRFGLNIVYVGDAAILGAPAAGVERVMRAHGLRPVVVRLDEFHRAGGSAACLVTRLHTERDASHSALIEVPAAVA